MSVTVEKLQGLVRKVELSLPWDTIHAEVDKRLKQTARRVRVDGFRPGKAPIKMVASMYGSSIQNDVLNDLAKKVFFDTAVSEGWKIAGMPRLEAVEGREDSENLYFAGIFEVFPQVLIGDLSAQEVTKVGTQVGDAQLDQTIDILRRQRTVFDYVARAAQKEDRVIIDFSGKIDGESFAGGSAENYAFVLGQNQMLPEFEAGVEGMKEGDSREVEVNFPEDYHGKDVAGKKAVFTISVKNVAEPRLPEVDAEFAKALGIEDGDTLKLREEVQKNVLREVNRRIDAQNKAAVMEALLQVAEFDVPQALVDEEAARLAEEMKQNFVNQGMKDAAAMDLKPEIFKEEAARRVKLGLIIAQLVEDKQLEAKQEQVDAIIADFAESYENPQEVIEWYHADASRLQGIKSLAIEKNVMDFVFGQAKVSEKELSFDEVMMQPA